MVEMRRNSRGARLGLDKTMQAREQARLVREARKAAGYDVCRGDVTERPKPATPRTKWQDLKCPGWEDDEI
jgi:hypothetical protein